MQDWTAYAKVHFQFDAPKHNMQFHWAWKVFASKAEARLPSSQSMLNASVIWIYILGSIRFIIMCLFVINYLYMQWILSIIFCWYTHIKWGSTHEIWKQCPNRHTADDSIVELRHRCGPHDKINVGIVEKFLNVRFWLIWIVRFLPQGLDSFWLLVFKNIWRVSGSGSMVRFGF